MTLFGVAFFKLCNGFVSGGGAEERGVGTAVFPNVRLGSGTVLVVVVVGVTASTVVVAVVGVVVSSLVFNEGVDEKYTNFCCRWCGGIM